MTCELHHADCMDWLPSVPDGSIDAIITDLPYGTTACVWDSVIPFAPMWAQIKRVLKPRGVFVTTASQPFTSALVMSNLEWFKYEWIWDKKLPTGFLNVSIRPLVRHETILIFSGAQSTYNPQMRKGVFRNKGSGAPSNVYGTYHKVSSQNDAYYPTSILQIDNANQSEKEHPTQKDVGLYEYLIRTYTNPGETVLDFTMGSGTSGVASIRTGRNFIGCELYPLPDKPIHERDNPDYFATAQRRCAEASLQPALFQLDAPPVEKQSNLL